MPQNVSFFIENHQKLLQMGWNFDQTYISTSNAMSSIRFQNIFDKFSKLTNFWLKNIHLARFLKFKVFYWKSLKNVPNELKLEPDMYFYEFYQILEDFWEIFKISRFLAEKPPFSAYVAFFFSILNFWRKM